MKANKRVRDPRRRSKFRLTAKRKDGIAPGTTTYPTLENRVRREAR